MKPINSRWQRITWAQRAVLWLVCGGLWFGAWLPGRAVLAQDAASAAQAAPPLTVRYIGMRDGAVGAPFHLAARVRAGDSAAPVAGATVAFTLLRADGSPAQRVEAVTGGDGIAAATVVFSEELAGGAVLASLAAAAPGASLRTLEAAVAAPRAALNAPQLTPATVAATLQAGQSITVSTQVTLPVTPDFPSDVVFAFEAGAGMAGFLPGVKGAAEDAMLALVADGLDVRFASIAFQDYPAAYSSFGYILGDSTVVTYGVAGAYPYSLTQPLTAAPAAVTAAFPRIQAALGGDPPASYTRALYEAGAELGGAADPAFGPLGYRADAAKLVVVFGDQTPHDNDLNEGVPGSAVPFITGGDPGRNNVIDEPVNPANIGVGNDDLDWQQVLARLRAVGVRLIRYELSPFYAPLWAHWAQQTGGQSVTPLDDLAAVIREGMLDAGPVGTVAVQAQSGFAAWLSVTPAQYSNVMLPAQLPFDVVVTPPAGTAPGLHTFTINLVGDGAVLATQQVSITVAPPPNRAPVAVNDAFTVTQESAGNVLAVLANDSDPDSDPLTLMQVSAPAHGAATRAGNTVLYTPTAGYVGADAFTYTVSDGKTTAQATVNLTVTPKPNRAPVAVNDAFTVTQESAGNVLAVLANDSDPDSDPLTLTQVSTPAHGAATRAGNTVLYTPTAGYVGADAFTYTVSDGKTTAQATVNLTVTPKPNRAPVAVNDAFTVTQESAGNVLAVLANDSDPNSDPLTLTQVSAPAHGAATRAGNTVLYTPTAGYVGADAFTYTVSDGKTTAQATVHLTVTPKPNRAPVAVNDAFTVTQESAGNLLAVLANDSDPDSDPLTLTQVSAPAHGAATRAGNTVLYTPTAGYVGADAFTYTVSDGKTTAQATVHLTVTPKPVGAFALATVGERAGDFADGVLTAGQLVTVTTRLTNTGAVTLTVPPLSQAFDPIYLARVSGSAGVTATLRAGESLTQRAVYRALATTQALSGSVTLVRATASGIRDSGGTMLPAQSAATPVRITAPGLSVSTQRAAGPALAVGGFITFTVDLLNSGDTTITHLPLRDAYPAGLLTFVRASAAGATVTAGVVQWPDLTTQLGNLAPGATVQLVLVYRIERVAADGARSVTVAGARDEFDDPLATATTTDVVMTPALSLGIAATPAAGSQVHPGRVVTYEMQLLNGGDTLLSDLLITAALTGDGSFLAPLARTALLAPCPLEESAPGTAGVRTWRVAELAVGASCGVSVQARVAISPTSGDLTLAATVQTAALSEPVAAEASHVIFPAAPLIVSFVAVSETTGIRLDWTTAWETGLDGFHIWRGTTSVRDDAIQLTTELLPAAGAPGSYDYTDTPPADGAYYYWLEPVGAWDSVSVGPLAVVWAPPPRLLLPLIFAPRCTVGCAQEVRLWVPLIFNQWPQ
jgi:uncharacterized repeat protein (TIGR01451 family)